MCTMSMVVDHHRGEWEKYIRPSIPLPYNPAPIPNIIPPLEQWWKEYQELKAKAAEIDKKLGLADCEDPKKAEFEKQVMDVLIKKGLIKQNV